jgi:hypothetical protein
LSDVGEHVELVAVHPLEPSNVYAVVRRVVLTDSFPYTGYPRSLLRVSPDETQLLTSASPIVITGGSSPLASFDRGSSWRILSHWERVVRGGPVNPSPFINCLALDSSGSNLFVGTDAGVWQISLRPPHVLPTRSR